MIDPVTRHRASSWRHAAYHVLTLIGWAFAALVLALGGMVLALLALALLILV